jgi:hypothetical protein
MMARRISLLLIAALILVFAIAASGCGSGDKGSGDSPSNVNDAVDLCVKKAKAIDDADARTTATEACKAAKSGNTSKVKDAARAECLDLTKRIPAGAQRDQAQKACKTGTK